MEKPEQMVLRRKRMTISLQVNLTQSYLSIFKHSGVRTDSIMAVIEKKLAANGQRKKSINRTESKDFQKMMKFLELLPQHANHETFPLLVSFLEHDYFWLGEELKAELLVEKDLLMIEDYIEKLAQLVVFEKFGKTKRLTVKEKAAIKDLVAKRVQYAKEVCRERLASLQDQLSSYRERGYLIDREMVMLTEKIKLERQMYDVKSANLCLDHMKNERGDTDKVFDSIGAENVTEEEKETDVESDLRMELDKLKEMLLKALRETGFLEEGRNDALKVFKSPPEDADLDDELKKILQKLLDALKAKKAWIAEKDRKCAELREQLRDLYSQIMQLQAEKEKNMLAMQKYLEKANDMARLIMDDIEQLQREYKFCQKKISQYKVRFAKMERTRHLGYLSVTAPERGNLAEVGQDKARAKAPIKKPRIIQVQATTNMANNNS